MIAGIVLIPLILDPVWHQTPIFGWMALAINVAEVLPRFVLPRCRWLS